MSCFPKLCKKKKKKPDNLQNEAVKKLEDAQKILTKQQEDLEKEIDICTITAKRNATNNKRAALRALQRKKYLEKRLEKVDNVLTTVAMQKDALEESPTTAAVVVSLRTAGEVLKKSNVSLDAGKVQDLMDDITEQYLVGNDISNAIRNSIVFETNEEELFRELEKLEDEELNTNLMQVPEIAKLPTASGESHTDTRDTPSTKHDPTKPSRMCAS